MNSQPPSPPMWARKVKASKDNLKGLLESLHMRPQGGQDRAD